MEEELIPVNILIGDRSYRLKIEIQHEEVLRKTAKLVNEKITEYRNEFAGKDTQDYIAMVLLWMATEQQKSQQYIIEAQETTKQLESLEAVLDKVDLKETD
jgi:cell division protein ZapA (FtsZ GTPase activity inhibitor)